MKGGMQNVKEKANSSLQQLELDEVCKEHHISLPKSRIFLLFSGSWGMKGLCCWSSPAEFLVSSPIYPHKGSGGMCIKRLLPKICLWRGFLDGPSCPLACQNTKCAWTRCWAWILASGAWMCNAAWVSTRQISPGSHARPFIMEKRKSFGPIYKFHGVQEETPHFSLRYAHSETHLEASSFQVISDFWSNLHFFTNTTGEAKRRCHS